MALADEFYLIYQKSDDIACKIIIGWEKHFDWLEEVVILAREARGKTVILKTPAAKRTKRKRKVSNDEEHVQSAIELQHVQSAIELQHVQSAIELEHATPVEQKSKRKRQKKISEVQKAVSTEVSSDSVIYDVPPADDLQSLNNKVNEEVRDVCDSNTESTEEINNKQDELHKEPVRPRRTTRATAQVPNRPITSSVKVEKHHEISTIKIPSASTLIETTFTKLSPAIFITTPNKNKGTSTKRKNSNHNLQAEDTIDEGELISKPPDEIICVEHTPKQRKTRAAAAQQAPQSPTLEVEIQQASKVEITPRNVKTSKSLQKKTPVRKHQNENVATNNLTKTQSPYTDLSFPKKKKACKLQDEPEASIKHSEEISPVDQDQKIKQIQTAVKVKSSPLTRTKQVLSASKNSLHSVKTASRVAYTPPPSSRTKTPLLKRSGSKYMQHSLLLSASPQIGSRMIQTPSEMIRTGNLVSGIGSFITRVQSTKPSHQEVEQDKLANFERKKEKQEEARRKQEEMRRLKTEEMKRRNEERTRRVHEARLAQERVLKQKEEEKLRHEKEQKQKEMSDRGREERDRKKKLLAMKAEEEMVKMARVKAQKEEEERIRVEKLREDEQRQLQLIKQKMETQKRMQEQKLEAERLAQERYEEEKKLAERLACEKHEMEQQKAKEMQVSHSSGQAELNSTYIKSSPNKITSYEMTPVPVKKTNPNNYDIESCKSDDSTDEECDPKKEIPVWAKGQNLRQALFNQEYYHGNKVGDIFPRGELLLAPDLQHIFPRKRSIFHKRTSSAVWDITLPLE